MNLTPDAVDASRFVIVLRASAAVRIPPGEHVQWRIKHKGQDWQLTFRTRYFDFGGDQMIPRELWVEAVGPAEDLDSAMGSAQGHANVAASVISTVMNAAVEELQVEIAFDASPGKREREFFQSFLLDETGLPRVARKLDGDAVIGTLSTLDGHPRNDRLFRAMAQYDLALRHWVPGHETLALAHLYMAMEALTPVALEAEMVRLGLATAVELAQAWGIEPLHCKSCGASYGLNRELEAEVRRRVLFQSDEPTYREAKRASDGLEHGFGDFEDIYGRAVATRDRLARFVRHAIFRLSNIDSDLASRILQTKWDIPVASARYGKYLRATLVADDPEAMLADGYAYPMFELKSSIKDVTLAEDGAVSVTPEETLRPILASGVEIQEGSFKIFGPAGVDVERTDSTESTT